MAKLTKREDYRRPKPDMTPPPGRNPWYAIVTNPNCEHRVAEALAGFMVFLPVSSDLVKGGGPKKEIRVSERALFSRYVFVANPAPGMFPFFALRGVRGVESIVKGGDGFPFPIAHDVVARIMERQDSGEWDRSVDKRTLAAHGLAHDQQMRVRSGPFEGLLVKIQGLTRGGQGARCLHDMLGRAITSTIPLVELERVA